MHNTDKLSQSPLIGRSYFDMDNQQQQISDDTLQRLAAALGETPAQDNDAPLPVVSVLTRGATDVPLTLLIAGNGDYHWHFTSEQGDESEGNISAGQSLALPALLELGYHSLTFSQSSLHQESAHQQLVVYQQQPDQAPRQWHCRVIVAPSCCYQPAELTKGQKLWGMCVQLYTLRSPSNWGIGDFGDLQKMLHDVVRCGMSFIGVNPLHALYPSQPDNASPYSPSSRRWLNIIYIDVNAVEDFQLNEEAEIWWTKETTRQQLNKVRDKEWVDYPAVMALKLEALTIAWRKFSHRNSQDPLMQEFHQFVSQGGDNLYWYAVHDALHQKLLKENPTCANWSQWPADLQKRNSSQVAAFCRLQASDIDFHCWLQWLAQRQLTACWKVCQQLAMPVGIYRDLAVGEAQYSAASWSDRSLYCMDVSIGAPADPLGPQGQNWQLPPINPHQLVQRAYQPFIDVLRANMKDCGALRIDHVMSLMRLWWVPAGCSAADGGYVHYPLDDLLAILALESQRNQCMIIGEDLGVVPPHLREKLQASGVYSYRVLYFETAQPASQADSVLMASQQPDVNQAQALQPQMLPLPKQWPQQALATINTHDLPTLCGYWEMDDLRLGDELGLYPDAGALASLGEQRQQRKQAIINSLHRDLCLSTRGKHASRMAMTPALRRAIYRYLASCRSALVGVQPEDWLNVMLPVNVPGTSDQYANWRRKLPRSLEEIFIDPTIMRLFSMIGRYRKQVSDI